MPPGGLVRLMAPSGKTLGVAQFNPHSLIAARLLDPQQGRADRSRFLRRRIARALQLRDRLFDTPYYRLIHAEADGLPGLIVDRFGDALVVQVNTAGMERCTPVLLEALEDERVGRATIVARNDSPARQLEGLAREVDGGQGRAAGQRLELIENGARRSSPTSSAARRPAGSTTSATTAASRPGSRGRRRARRLQLLRRLRA